VVRDIAPTALRAGFLTPCRDRLSTVRPSPPPPQFSTPHPLAYSLQLKAWSVEPKP
jgi:hypothetical protein